LPPEQAIIWEEAVTRPEIEWAWHCGAEGGRNGNGTLTPLIPLSLRGEGITARDSGCPAASSRPAGCASHAIVVRMPAVRGNSDRGDVPAANLTAKASG